MQYRNYVLQITAVGLPETWTLHVCILKDYMQVQIVCRDSYDKFDWETWRDSFIERLSGLRKWHSETRWWNRSASLNSLDDQLTYLMAKQKQKTTLSYRFKIQSGILRINLFTTRVGGTLTVWKGWLPHRLNLCHFELESEGLIKPRKNLGYKFVRVNINAHTINMKVPDVTNIKIKYDRCDLVSLSKTAIIVSAAIFDPVNGNGYKDCSLRSLAGSLKQVAEISRLA